MNYSPKCCVPNCSNTWELTKNKVIYFRFPTNEDVKQKWFDAIKWSDEKPGCNHCVCADHFKPEDLGSIDENTTIVPTVFKPEFVDIKIESDLIDSSGLTISSEVFLNPEMIKNEVSEEIELGPFEMTDTPIVSNIENNIPTQSVKREIEEDDIELDCYQIIDTPDESDNEIVSSMSKKVKLEHCIVGSTKPSTESVQSGNGDNTKVPLVTTAPTIIKERLESILDWNSEYFCVVNRKKWNECLICGFASNRKYNCERHYRTKHSNDFTTYTEKKTAFDQMRTNFFASSSTSSSIEIDIRKCSLKASYIVSYNIAKSKKPLFEAEFLKKNFEDVLKCFGPTCEKSLKCVSSINLSRTTVGRRITDLSLHVVAKLKKLLAESRYFSIAIDESIDVSDTSQLLIFVRIITEKLTTYEELLSCVPLHSTTKDNIIDNTIDIFNAVESKILEFCSFEKLSGVCTDGTPAMMRKINELKGIMKKKNINVPFYHCAKPQEAEWAKSFNIKATMDVVSKSVNKLRGRQNVLKHRELKMFLKETEAAYEDVTPFTQVDWLNRGNSLNRFFELRKDILNFLETRINYSDNTKLLISKLKCSEFVTSLAFVNDLLIHLNKLNLNLQGTNLSIFETLGNIDGFKLKLKIFKTDLQQNNLAHFKSCLAVSEEFPNSDFSKFVPELEILINQFNERFQECEGIRFLSEIFGNPIHCTIANQPINFQLELCDLQADVTLKNSKETGIEFWKLVSPSKFPNLFDAVIKSYSLFSSTYTWESTFSHMVMIKKQYGNRLCDEQFENLLRLATTAISIDFDQLAQC